MFRQQKFKKHKFRESIDMPSGAYPLSDDKLFGSETISIYGRRTLSSFIYYKEEKRFTYEQQGQRVKQIAHDSTRFSDEGILKVYKMESDLQNSRHVLYYEHFDKFMHKNLFKINHQDEMKDRHGNLTAWARDSIRNVMVTVKKVWDKKLFLKGLGDPNNFVIVGDKIKIINIMSSTDVLVDSKEWENGKEIEPLDEKRFKAHIRNEIKNIKMLWETLLASADAWPERDNFLDFFDRIISPWETHMDKIITHPFLKDPEGRVKYFSEIRHQYVTQSIPRMPVFEMAIRHDFVKYTKDPNTVKMSPPLKELFTTDAKGKFTWYGSSALELMRFLRNAYEHRGTNFPVCDLDREIRKLWPGFLEILHEKR